MAHDPAVGAVAEPNLRDLTRKPGLKPKAGRSRLLFNLAYHDQLPVDPFAQESLCCPGTHDVQELDLDFCRLGNRLGDLSYGFDPVDIQWLFVVE